MKTTLRKRDYHSFPVINLGCSDIAALVMVGYVENKGVVPKMLNLGADGKYSAHLVDESVEIPEHYQKVAEYTHWLRMYDDAGLVYEATAGKFEICTSGNFGILIRITKNCD